LTVDCCNRMILGRRAQSALLDAYERSGRKRAHFAVCGEGLWHAAEQVEPNPSGGLGIPRDAAARHEGLDLGSKAQCRPIVRIVQRLDPIWITRQQQLLLLAIPYTEREHAPSLAEHLVAQLSIEVQQDLGIRIAPECVALRLQSGPQRAIVVDLAVESNDQPAIRSLHWLGAARRQIDNREAAMLEADS